MFADWTRPFTGIATAFSALVTQAFLSHRVFKLTKNKPLTATLAVSIIAAFGFGFTSGIKGYLVNGTQATDVKPMVSILTLMICWPSILSFADLLISGVLIFVLSRSKTGFRRTDKIINSLIRGAIQSGLLVTMFTLGDLLAFTLSLKTNLAALFVYPLGRIYTNVYLNSFKHLSTGLADYPRQDPSVYAEREDELLSDGPERYRRDGDGPQQLGSSPD